MPRDEPECLWNFGEPEPWRRGRNILLTIFCFYALLHASIFLLLVLRSALEGALTVAVVLLIWWLMFAFVWCGTHWLRWLLGGLTMLNGFALFIWGIRDENVIQWSAGVIDLVIGAFCFAPSVHFFAVRQKEHIRWPEKLAVAGVFLLLIGSCFLTLLGVNTYRVGLEREARHYGEEALRRMFVENDTAYLLGEADQAWLARSGNLGVTRPLTEKFIYLGAVWNTRVTKAELRSLYRYPATLDQVGIVDGLGYAKCGEVALRLQVVRTQDGWRISGFWWRCINR